MSAGRRRELSAALVVLAAIAGTAALVLGYARHALVDPGQFADRATAALRHESVRKVVAQRIADDVTLGHPAGLGAARPLIDAVTESAIDGAQFTLLFRAAVLRAHRALLQGDGDALRLTIDDAGVVIAEALAPAHPILAAEVRQADSVEIFEGDLGSISVAGIRAANDARALAVILLVIALLCAGGALVVSPDRRATTAQLGVGLAIGGVLVFAGYAIARSAAVHRVGDPDTRAAVGDVFDAFLGGLRTAGVVLAAAGAGAAVVAALLARAHRRRRPA